MMATTEIEKVPATIQSRSQVFELKTIGVKPIADQLRTIADAERITVDDAALMLIARAGDGSMRDAQSAFDQVIAFAGATLRPEDVSTVLGLVRRDLLIEMADAAAREDAAAVFGLASRAVEAGYDLRSVIRELARLTRDLLVLSIDPARAADPEIAAESERQPLLDLAKRFSGEDLMRAFDVLTKAEYDIRGAAQPRYHLEMALLRWIHLRKLVPLTDLMTELRGGSKPPAPAAVPPRAPAGSERAASVKALEARRPAPASPPRPLPARDRDEPSPTTAPKARNAAEAAPAGDFKDAFLEEVRKAKKFFHGTVVAQAQRIDASGDRVVFVFAPQHRALRTQLDQNRPWLEEMATRLAGRKMIVLSAEGTQAGGAGTGESEARDDQQEQRQQSLKERAMSDSGVQAMLDVFAAEIRDVEEM